MSSRVGSSREPVDREFPTQVTLGSDGLRSIVALTGLSREDVAEVTSAFRYHPREEVEAFFSA